MDAGDIWASATFPTREASKGSLYRNEVTEAAVATVREALDRIAHGGRPRPLDYARPGVRGRLRPAMRQADRAIDWTRDDTTTVLRKIRAADGTPGVRDDVLGVPCHVYDAHCGPDGATDARPGSVVGRHGDAILRATVDGAVWITHLKRIAVGGHPSFKLPAAMALGESVADLPELPFTPSAASAIPVSWPIRYDEHGGVGVLHFPFYNGAMSTSQCVALRHAVTAAHARPIRVLVLAGGADFWSNGIHLNVIEASGHAADASWQNIEAMNDLVLAILSTDSQLTIAALQGNAGAGGCFLALAADRVVARRGIVLNPHYKSMGNLYGSEYWTYLLPRRVGADRAAAIVASRLPMTAAQAAAIGLVDEAFGASPPAFLADVIDRAQALAGDSALAAWLASKAARRASDEAAKPLARYREEELARMQLNFFGFDPSYHVARYHFVHKLPKARTPSFLARHRTARSA